MTNHDDNDSNNPIETTMTNKNKQDVNSDNLLWRIVLAITVLLAILSGIIWGGISLFSNVIPIPQDEIINFVENENNIESTKIITISNPRWINIPSANAVELVADIIFNDNSKTIHIKRVNIETITDDRELLAKTPYVTYVKLSDRLIETYNTTELYHNTTIHLSSEEVIMLLDEIK